MISELKALEDENKRLREMILRIVKPGSQLSAADSRDYIVAVYEWASRLSGEADELARICSRIMDGTEITPGEMRSA